MKIEQEEIRKYRRRRIKEKRAMWNKKKSDKESEKEIH